MARKRFRPMALCGSSNKGKAIYAYLEQPCTRRPLQKHYYVEVAGVSVEITEEEATQHGEGLNIKIRYK